MPPTGNQSPAATFLGGAYRSATFLVAIALCAAPGCEDRRRPVAPRAEHGFIAFVGTDADDPRWRVLQATALRSQEGLAGFEVRTAVPRSPSANAQIALLRQMHVPEMRGLCIQPADQFIMRDVLEDLRIKGVPIVTVLTPIEGTTNFMHAGLDELAVGEAMAEAIHHTLKGQGTIAVLYNANAPRHRADRLLGFKQRLAQMPGIIVLREFDCRGNDFVAQRTVRDYLERFPRLDGWVAMENWPLHSLVSNRRLLPATCTMVTFGPFPRYWGRVSDGTCYALIGTRYEPVAENALRMCVAAARGEVPTVTRHLAPPLTITRDNLTTFKLDWHKSCEKPTTRRSRTSPHSAPGKP